VRELSFLKKIIVKKEQSTRWNKSYTDGSKWNSLKNQKNKGNKFVVKSIWLANKAQTEVQQIR
jgi:hypothetical protein